MKQDKHSREPKVMTDTQQRDKKETPAVRVHRSPEQWSDLISQRIEEAMSEGKFDNLRNKGKPLDPTPEPHVPPDMQMANSLLKNNNLTPAWIGDRAQTLAEIERFRSKVCAVTAEYNDARRTARTAADHAAIERRWQAQLATWQEEIRTLNRRIELQNFKQPVSFLEIMKLRLDDELKRAQKTILQE